MISVERDGDVFLLRWEAGENRFNAESVSALHASLDEVESASSPRALVLIGSGKFFTNGLDLEWMQSDGADARTMLAEMQRAFGRVLSFPAMTAAAVNGHAFGAGAMFVQCFDRRVMRTDRGYWCLPEADLGMSFSPGMNALLRSRLDPSTVHEAMLTGRRYGGEDARAARIVDVAVPEEDLVGAAVAEVAPGAGRDGAVLATIKRMLHADAADRLLAGGG
jgi:enoyl-CoA hydratase/carnithine racemase